VWYYTLYIGDNSFAAGGMPWDINMGAGTGWAGWVRAHPGNNLGGHCPA